MSASLLNTAHFQSEQAAYEHVEGMLWPNGPVCPHCGVIGRAYTLKGNATRIGLKKCAACRKQFTVKIGTIFEDSHIPLHKWLQAIHLLCASKKGISSHQLHRMLGISLKSAWFLSHRIREAMRDGSLGPLGGGHGFGNAVEADETFIGRKEGAETPKGGYSHKNAVLALVERGGKVKCVHIDNVTSEEVGEHVRENVAREAWLMTDEGRHYRKVGEEFAGHSTRQPHARRVRRPRGCHDPHQHRRGLLLDLQARDEGRLPALPREAPAPLCGRVRVPLQQPDRAGRGRQRTRGQCAARRCRQAPHLSAARPVQFFDLARP